MKKVLTAKKSYLDKKSYSVVWRITEKCNFDCDYCGSHNNYAPVLPVEKALEIARWIPTIKTDYLDTGITGGEPTTYRGFRKVVKELVDGYNKNDRSGRIEISTNLTKSVDYYKTLIDICRNTKPELRFFISYHREFFDYDVMGRRITELKEYGGQFYPVAFMINTPMCVEEYKAFTSKYNIDCIPSKIFQRPWVAEGLEPNFEDGAEGGYVIMYKDGEEYLYENVSPDRIDGITRTELLVTEVGKKKTWVCLCYDSNISITSNGEIKPCVLHEEKTDFFDVKKREEAMKKKCVICRIGNCCDVRVPRYDISEYRKISNMKWKDIKENVKRRIDDS